MSNEALRGTAISCDVLVVGGGAAGVAAAAAAGGAGARVVLLERYGFLGGLATAAQVGTICGLYLRSSANGEPTPVARGFCQQFASRLQGASGLAPLRLTGGLWVLPCPSPVFARLADAALSESENVRIIHHATAFAAQAEGARVVEVRALAWNEPLVLRPRNVVDASGEATVASLAGARVEEGAGQQAPALVFALEGLAPDFVPGGWLGARRELHRAVETGRLPAGCEGLALVPGTGAHGHAAFKLNLAGADPARPVWQQVTDWEREGRALVDVLQHFLAANTPGCGKARLLSVAPQLGVRSGRRIEGRARLTDPEVLGARKSPFGVARGAWPMERWGKDPRPDLTFFDERGYYEIPLDCLRPAELDNVLVAGRCFCAEAGAMSSARVIGTALATGWAAGMAAAVQALHRPLEEAVATLRQQMDQ